jgi:hypothetical protein
MSPIRYLAINLIKSTQYSPKLDGHPEERRPDGCSSSLALEINVHTIPAALGASFYVEQGFAPQEESLDTLLNPNCSGLRAAQMASWHSILAE